MTPLERARANYRAASRNLVNARQVRGRTMYLHHYKGAVYDALDQLAGAQELARLCKESSMIGWTDRNLHRIINNGTSPVEGPDE